MLPEEEANVVRECALLRRDLEFCQSEIERLRAKLVISTENDDETQITATGWLSKLQQPWPVTLHGHFPVQTAHRTKF